jgi:hypothetical protein
MKNRFVPFSLVMLLGLAIAAWASVKTDYNHSIDFGQYHTYSWLKVEAGNDLWTDRIMHAVDSQLAAKGWSKVPAGGDAAVAAFGAVKHEQTMQTFYDGFGGGWFWRGFGDGMATTTVENIPIGSLVVDIFDGHTKKLIFRGSASETLSDKPEKNEKKLEKSVEEMFKHFPPPAKG